MIGLRDAKLINSSTAPHPGRIVSHIILLLTLLIRRTQTALDFLAVELSKQSYQFEGALKVDKNTDHVHALRNVLVFGVERSDSKPEKDHGQGNTRGL